MNRQTSDRFSRNYQVIKAQVQKDGFKGVSVLQETNRRVEKLDRHMNDDLRPVSIEEGFDLFTDYYNSLKDDNKKQKRDFDFKRKKRDPLKPGEFQSYLFRPTAEKSTSGPAIYDMEGVDDATENVLGHGMPPLEKLTTVKARSKRYQ